MSPTTHTPVSIQLDTHDPVMQRLATLTRQRLGGDCREDADWVLRLDDSGVELLGPGEKPGSGLRAAIQRPRRVGPQEPLARALGPSSGEIIDATGGLGEDALRMFSLGHPVTLIERNPVVFALLEGARLERRLPFPVLYGDALELLTERKTDVVYLDPMFPAKRRASALPPKGPRYLSVIVGSDPDVSALLQAARFAARERVVVKRPDHAPTLEDNPRACYEGKLVRYDVYGPLADEAAHA